MYLGLFAESINGATLVNASFDNVAITGGAAPLVAAPDSGFEVHEAQQILDFKVYPNPTAGELYVDLTAYQHKVVSLEVYSLQGQLLQAAKIEDGQSTERLDLSAYQNGTYLVKMKAEGLPDVTKRVVLGGI